MSFTIVGASEYKLEPKVLSWQKRYIEKHGLSYDESKASQAEVPDLFLSPYGTKISTARDWVQARPLIKKIMAEEFYGTIAPRPASFEVKLVESSDNALNGKAIRRQYKLISRDKAGDHSFVILVYIPKNAKYPVPAFQGLNFYGNYTVSKDKEIIMPDWVRNSNKPHMKIRDNRARDELRGSSSSRWCVEEIISRGFALVTAYYCDIHIDDSKTRGGGFYKIFGDAYKDGGAISAWAWGHSRILDALETIPEIDARRVAVVGHSRLGKAALWAGANDERFSIVVSNNSGCMGAAFSRRKYGENLAIITYIFRNWFSPNIDKYAGAEEKMPLDQHHLLALVAPRGLYVTSATLDHWADPKGELFSLVEASKVYEKFGAENLPTMKNFRVEEPFFGDVGYHLRNGKHDMTTYDWNQFMNYASKYWGLTK